MKALLQIAASSAWNRRGTLALVVLSIALATGLLLTLERLRSDIRSSFALAVSGTDLVVGARTGPVQLMLYAVFRVGGATNKYEYKDDNAFFKVIGDWHRTPTINSREINGEIRQTSQQRNWMELVNGTKGRSAVQFSREMGVQYKRLGSCRTSCVKQCRTKLTE